MDSLASNLATQERERQAALRTIARLRKQAGDYGDDREDEDEHDETSLGWTDREAKRGHYSTSERELDRSDDEPSLGSPVMNAMSEYRSQENWVDGGTADREEDRNDDEPGEGWPMTAA